MKKLAIILLALVASLSAYAQREREGDFGLGLNLGIAPSLEKAAGATNIRNFGLGLRAQYNLSNPVRLEANLNYWFKSNCFSMFDAMFNFHYVFDCSDKFALYPIAGIGYANVRWSDIYVEWEKLVDSGSVNRFAFNAGLGAEFAVGSSTSIFLEVKYQYLKNFQRLPVQIGVVQRF